MFKEWDVYVKNIAAAGTAHVVMPAGGTVKPVAAAARWDFLNASRLGELV